MNPRMFTAPVVASALLFVAFAGGSAPAARPGPESNDLDLLASAHPSAAQPTVGDVALDQVTVRGYEVDADTAALTSATCDGCVGESTALHVIFAPRAGRARLDNVATAWSQQCTGCLSTALSVQVVVLRSGQVLAPNNRALAINAACDGCRTGALAFQVVLVSDRPEPMSRGDLAELRAWVDAQAAALRASVSGPLSEQPTSTPTATPTPDPTVTPDPSENPSESPTPTPSPLRTARVKRDAVSALGDLKALLADALDAQPVSADVEVSR